jgi:hypothetical protein
MNLQTPDSVIGELVAIRQQASKGVDALYAAEVKLAQLNNEAETVEAKALISAEGTVVDRQAVAKLKSAEQRLAADIAKAELNRVRAKLKVLSEQQMSVQTEARMVEMMYRTAGLGER